VSTATLFPIAKFPLPVKNVFPNLTSLGVTVDLLISLISIPVGEFAAKKYF